MREIAALQQRLEALTSKYTQESLDRRMLQAQQEISGRMLESIDRQVR